MKEKLNHRFQGVSLRQLRALAALARTGTVKGAAEALCVTPPAITLQLRLLETLVGQPLVERGPRRMRLTAVGRELVEASHRIEMVLADCALAVDQIVGLDGGQVAVGVISTAKYFAPRALAAFKRAHPKIELKLAIGNRKETVAALAAFDLDFAVMGRPPADFEVERSVLGPHPHVVIAPPGHPMADQANLPVAALRKDAFLLREPGSGTRALAEDLFHQAGLHPPAGMEIGSNETIKQAVIAGLGLALISAHTIAAEVEDHRIAVLDVQGTPVVRQWFLVRHKDRRLTPPARALWHFLETEAKTFLPSALGSPLPDPSSDTPINA